jgi:hypothetical protein
VTSGRRVDGVRCASYPGQRARRSNFDHCAGVLSAGQSNLLDGEKTKTGARVYFAGSDAVYIRCQRCSKDAIEKDLHGLSWSPAGAECPKSGRRIWVDDFVSCTHESIPGTHGRAFRAARLL